MKKWLKDNWLRYLMLIIALAINIFILVNAFIKGQKSGEISNGASQIAENVINTAIPGTITDASRPSFRAFFRKFAGHFALFGLDGIFTTITYYLFLKKTALNHNWIICLISGFTGFAIAMASELAQIVTEGRSGTMRDVLIDFAGYLIAIILVLIVALILQLNMIKFEQKKQA